MTTDAENCEPTQAELEDIPEQDFSDAVAPNRYANLRGDYEHAVFLDKELWEHFGSAERVVEALQLLLALAQRRSA